MIDLSAAANISTITTALIAAVAIWFGTRQFSQTQRLMRETQAVELLIKFNELGAKTNTDPLRAFWSSNAQLTITESIHHLTRGNKSWDATVLWMLNSQSDFLQSTPIDCNTYSPSFLAVMKESTLHFKCI